MWENMRAIRVDLAYEDAVICRHFAMSESRPELVQYLPEDIPVNDPESRFDREEFV